MALTAQELDFAYPRAPQVLRGVSCAIVPAALTALVGPNGAGKSTLVRLLAGIRTPDRGRVNLGDGPLSAMPARARARRVAFIEQRPDVAFDFSVLRVVSFGAYAVGGDGAHIDDALDRFELRRIMHTPYGSLSVGQQQRVSLARAWVQIGRRPDTYLLADEPCSAMDPRHTLQAMHALCELARSGVGVGVVLHDLSIAARFADRALVLAPNGTLCGDGPADEVLTERVLSAVFGLPIARYEPPDAPPVLIARDETGDETPASPS